MSEFTKAYAAEHLAPLMQEALDAVVRFGPGRALTGPIQRGDADTVRLHLEALRSDSEATQLYSALGRRALRLAQDWRADTPDDEEIAEAAARLSAKWASERPANGAHRTEENGQILQTLEKGRVPAATCSLFSCTLRRSVVSAASAAAMHFRASQGKICVVSTFSTGGVA